MNELTLQPASQVTSITSIESSRAIQDSQSALIAAKRDPRNEIAALNKILNACKRKSLAEVAVYSYPRGGTKVTGPSIRLAEAMAQYWGNLQFGITELEQVAGQTLMLAYCWDLETNVRQTKTWWVKHERHTKVGKTLLTDPRDIYEIGANQGARRLRSCILGVIPGDIVECALEECNKTLMGDNQEPVIDKVRRMVAKMAEYGVTSSMIEKKLGHSIESTTINELVDLGKIYTSLKDGMGSVDQFFTRDALPETEKKTRAQEAKERINLQRNISDVSAPLYAKEASEHHQGVASNISVDSEALRKFQEELDGKHKEE